MNSSGQRGAPTPGDPALGRGEQARDASASARSAAPPLATRIALAGGLFLLAPLVAEFLLGNIAIDAIAALIVLAPMYGGAAVLIREVTRRTGRGWPTIILLGLAYGVFEEGLVTQSLFNPGYAGVDLLSVTYVPFLGIGVWWTLFVLTLHTVWSTSVPIALIEALSPEWHDVPWLDNIGLGVAAVLFVLGSALSFLGTFQQFQFIASPAQLAGTVVAILVLIGCAFRLTGRPRALQPGAAPNPWFAGGFALAAGSLFMGVTLLNRDLSGWVLVAVYLALYAVVIGMVTIWSRSADWGPAQVLALAGGALLTYAWHAFPQSPVLGSSPALDLIGNVVFGLGALLLLVVAIARQRAAQTKAAA